MTNNNGYDFDSFNSDAYEASYNNGNSQPPISNPSTVLQPNNNAAPSFHEPFDQEAYEKQFQQNTMQQPNYNQPNYDQPYKFNQFSQHNDPPMTVKDWLITFLIMFIPFVNFVMIFVWAFSPNTNKSKANFFKAQLILFVAIFIISIIMSIAFGALLMQLFSTG